MTALTVRRLPWAFGPDTPFQWNPANPAFGLGMNTLTFLAPAFERYIVLAVREALLPWHSQADEPTPRFADEWIAQYAQGRDVVDWYGDRRAGAA